MPHSLSIPYTKNFLSQGLELLIRCIHRLGTCPYIVVPDLTHTFMKFKPKFYAPILHWFIVSLPWAELPTGYQEKDKIKLHDIFQKLELSLLRCFISQNDQRIITLTNATCKDSTIFCLVLDTWSLNLL